jgi:hypothetical protein
VPVIITIMYEGRISQLTMPLSHAIMQSLFHFYSVRYKGVIYA